MSKVNVVFKDGAEEVDNWARTAATGLGISRQAALEAAGTFGGFLISMGLAPKAAQEMSKSLVELASDLASFNNTSPEEALIAIRSGLVGEVEPLRRYQVALSAARIEQEAAAAGINKTSAEMSAAEKATFAYQIILKDTALAQGDFARTSDGLANQQRILAARFKDAQAQLGAALVPLLLTAAKAATTLGKGLAAANKATDGWLGALAGAAAVGGGVALLISKVGSGVARLVAAFQTQAAATTFVTSTTVANTAATNALVVANERLAMSSIKAGTALKTNLAQGLAAVAAGFLLGKKAGDEIIKLTTDAPPKVDELTASLLRLSKGQQGAFDFEGIGKDFRNQVTTGEFNLEPGAAFNNVTVFARAFKKDAREAKQVIGPLNDSLKAILETEGVDAATRAYGLLIQGFREQGVEIDTLTGNFSPFQSALDLARAKQEDTSATTKNLTADFQGLSDSIAKQTTTLGIADSLDAAQDAVDELNELKLDAAGQGQRSIDAARAEKRAQDSLSDAYDSQNKAAEGLLEAKAKLADFDSATDVRIRELERQQITSRIVTTPEEARQKEIDLLKFDDDAIERRADLERSVASAADGVTAAEERTADALVAVSDAAEARRQVQVDAADAIAAAERRAEQQTLAAVDAVLAARDAQLIGNDALALYLQLLGEMSGTLDPNGPLAKRLKTFLDQLVMADVLKQSIEGSLGPAGPTGPGGTFPFPNLGGFQPPAPPTGPTASAAATSIDYHPTTTVIAPDQPTTQTLNTLNRKQARSLTIAGTRG